MTVTIFVPVMLKPEVTKADNGWKTQGDKDLKGDREKDRGS